MNKTHNSDSEHTEHTESDDNTNISDTVDADLLDDYSSDGDMETVDVTDNMMYLILGAFFEDNDNKNIAEHLGSLTDAVNSNTDAVNNVANQLSGMLSVLTSGTPSRTSKEKSSKKKVKKAVG